MVLPIFNEKKPIRFQVKLALAWGTHFRTRYSYAFTGPWREQIARTRTFGNARVVMTDYGRTVRQSMKAERERLAHLKKFAGETGTDENGLRLDQRNRDFPKT
jgi:hypothetical protein